MLDFVSNNIKTSLESHVKDKAETFLTTKFHPMLTFKEKLIKKLGNIIPEFASSPLKLLDIYREPPSATIPTPLGPLYLDGAYHV